MLWWGLRGYTAVVACLALWPHSAVLAVAVPVAVALGALLFPAPGDLPGTRPRRSGVPVVLADLVLATVAVLASWLLWPGLPGFVSVFALFPVAARLPRWAAVLNTADSTARSRTVAATVCAGGGLVLVAGLLSPLVSDTAAQVRACTQVRAAKGAEDGWPDAAPAPDEPDDGPFGSAQWSDHRAYTAVGGHTATVTTANADGLAVRSAQEGEVLWHVDGDSLTGRPDLDHVDDVSQVGGAVVFEHRVQDAGSSPGPAPQRPSSDILVALDAATGAPAWCVRGASDVRPVSERPDRFVARPEGPMSTPVLYDSADGSVVAGLSEPEPEDPADAQSEVFMYVGSEHVVLWRDAALRVHSTEDGAELFAWDRAGGGNAQRHSVNDATVVDGTVVVAFRPKGDLGENDPVMVGFDTRGEEQWDSSEEEVEVPEGATFGECDTTSRGTTDGFDGHLLATAPETETGPEPETGSGPGGNAHAVLVDAADGGVTWEEENLTPYRCGMGTAVGDLLYLPGGEVAGVPGVEPSSLPAGADLIPVPAGIAVSSPANPLTLHENP